MKSLTLLLTTLAIALTLSGMRAFAQHGGGHGGGGMGGGSGMSGGAGMGRGSGNMGPDMGMNVPSMGTKNPDQMLSHNPKLSSRLQTLLPAGADVAKAASGFKNLGQFVSAVHVAHNLNIPFSELKERMISGDSLGQAIHGLRPDVNAKEAAKNANREAKDTLHEAGY